MDQKKLKKLVLKRLTAIVLESILLVTACLTVILTLNFFENICEKNSPNQIFILLGVLLAGFILICSLNAYVFFREIEKEMEGLRSSIENTMEKRLESEQERQSQIAAISHDIKTPLQLISGHTEILEGAVSTPDQQRHLDGIARSSAKISRLINTMMEIARDSVDIRTDRRNQDVHAFLTQIAEEARGLCTMKGLHFYCVADLERAAFSFDRGMLERAVLNLVQNGVDYSPSGGRLKLAAICKEDYFLVEVTDSGRGFSQEALNNGTRQFYRGEAQPKDGHYGLGLYTASRVAQSHGGGLTLSNCAIDGKICGGVAQITIKDPVAK